MTILSPAKTVSSEKKKSHRAGSNCGPADYESAALPTELRWLAKELSFVNSPPDMAGGDHAKPESTDSRRPVNRNHKCNAAHPRRRIRPTTFPAIRKSPAPRSKTIGWNASLAGSRMIFAFCGW